MAPASQAKVHAAPSQTKLQVAPDRHVKVQAAPLQVGAQVEPFAQVTVEPAPQAVVQTPVQVQAPPAETEVPHPLEASSTPPSSGSPPTSQSWKHATIEVRSKKGTMAMRTGSLWGASYTARAAAVRTRRAA